MTPAQRARYNRQIRLSEIGERGQQRLLDARVLIIGMGGLGSPVALYLAAAGVGQLQLSDYDQVEASNLQRQIIHTETSIGALKVESAQRRLAELNPDCEVVCHAYALEGEALREVVRGVDLVLDCTDNFPSRFELNRACLETRTPWVSAAAIRREGQLTTFDPRQADAPCYQCLYHDTQVEGVSCAMEGVVAPIVGILGSMQAQEAINVLLGQSALTGRLMMFDGALMEWHSMKLPKRSACPACGG